MGDILGLGVTHYPPLLIEPRYWSRFTEKGAETGRIPADLFADTARWPVPMRAEWGNDKGEAVARGHRERLIDAFRTIRRRLDEFDPDFVVIWGDDQFENFRQDCIPAFCIYIFNEIVSRPLGVVRERFDVDDNVWHLPEDTPLPVKGHPEGASALCRGLLERAFDVAYAQDTSYKRGLAHSFNNTILFLDYDRSGFGYPVVPFHVNCFGNRILTQAEGANDALRVPPSPGPARCFAIGRATAQCLRDSPWRVALIASSSWSHANLTKKHDHLYPDVAADRRRFAELCSGDYRSWGEIPLANIEDSGQHEFLNWICLAGAMTELDRRFETIEFQESYLFNSSKCLGAFV